MKQLYGRANNEMTLKDALTASLPVLSAKKTVALLYTPQHCKLAVLQNGVLRQSDGMAVDLTEVFEARVFNEDAELRWLNEQDGTGRAVLLSDSALTVSALDKDASLWVLDKQLEQTYLLWGEGVEHAKAGLPAEWSRLTTARIGKLDVPLANVGKSGLVQLLAKEYLAVCDPHGNVAVVEERLLKLEVV